MDWFLLGSTLVITLILLKHLNVDLIQRMWCEVLSKQHAYRVHELISQGKQFKFYTVQSLLHFQMTEMISNCKEFQEQRWQAPVCFDGFFFRIVSALIPLLSLFGFSSQLSASASSVGQFLCWCFFTWVQIWFFCKEGRGLHWIFHWRFYGSVFQWRSSMEVGTFGILLLLGWFSHRHSGVYSDDFFIFWSDSSPCRLSCFHGVFSAAYKICLPEGSIHALSAPLSDKLSSPTVLSDGKLSIVGCPYQQLSWLFNFQGRPFTSLLSYVHTVQTISALPPDSHSYCLWNLRLLPSAQWLHY